MRWFVEVSPLGQKAGPATTFVVDAAQWQPALQTARKLEGGDGALTNFSIELLEDGYRAIDPVSRQRYVIRRAPDDTALTNGAAAPAGAAKPAAAAPAAQPAAAAPQPAAVTKAPLAAVPTTTPSVGVEPTKKRAAAQTVAYSSAGAAAIREAAGLPPPAPAAPAAAPPPAVAVAPYAGLPGFTVIGKREDNPSARSPLSYREYVYAIPEGTSEEAAARVLLQSFLDVRKELESARPGKLINLAVFDHVFQGRPMRAPVVTLSWKDWKGVEPEIRFPLRDGAGETPTPMAGPASGVPESAMAMLGAAGLAPAPATLRAAAAPGVSPAAAPAAERSSPVPTPSSAPIASPSPVSAPRPAPVAVAAAIPVAAPKPIAAAPIPVPAQGAAPAPVASPHHAEPEVAKVLGREAAPAAKGAAPAGVAAPTAPIPAAAPAAPAPEAAGATRPSAAEPVATAQAVAVPAPAAAPAPSAPQAVAAPAPAPDAAPAPAAPQAGGFPAPAAAAKDSASAAGAPPPAPASAKRRLSGDDLLGELFEAFSDLHFLRDTLDGADFVLALAMENLPCEVGLISLFDINRREYVVVRQLGGARTILCARQPERTPLADSAMRKRHAIVVSDPAGARRAMDDRWEASGTQLRSLMCAPVEVGGRYLGLIELANPAGAGVFSDGDGNALTYIGEQFAEFVAARGVVVDAAAIRAAAQKGR